MERDLLAACHIAIVTTARQDEEGEEEGGGGAWEQGYLLPCKFTSSANSEGKSVIVELHLTIMSG